MLGNNPKRPPEKGDGSSLAVKHIFKTIQGEGPNTGVPAIFLRLWGCNLACSFCDTDFEGEKNQIKIDEIVKIICNLSNNLDGERKVGLVVITGGEPFRQNLGPICEKLIDAGFQVQIETNGTLYREIPEDVQIICSPKVVKNKYLSVHPQLLPTISAFKFLISSNLEAYSSVPDLGQAKLGIDVFVQPMDEYQEQINQRNKNLTVDIAINNGYRLSYQIHKELKIE